MTILAVEGHAHRLIPGPTLFTPAIVADRLAGHAVVNSQVRDRIKVFVPFIYDRYLHSDGKLLRSTTGDHPASRQRRR